MLAGAVKESMKGRRPEPVVRLSEPSHGSSSTELDARICFLEKRLRLLEGRERRVRGLLVCVIIGAAGLLLAGSKGAAPSVLEGEGLVIRDGQGNERARISIGADRSVAFVMLDREGRKRVALGAAEDGTTALRLANTSGRPQVVAQVRSWGAPSVTVANEKATARAALSVGRSDVAAVKLLNPTDRQGAELTASADGVVRLALSDSGGRPRAELQLATDGTPKLRLNDAKGAALVEIPQSGTDPERSSHARDGVATRPEDVLEEVR